MKISAGREYSRVDSCGAVAWAVSPGRCGCGRVANRSCANCLHAICENCAQIVRGSSGGQSFCSDCRLLDFSASEAEAVSAAAFELDRLGCCCGDSGWLRDSSDRRVFFVTILGTRRCPMRPTTITAATKAAAFLKALRKARLASLLVARRQRAESAGTPEMA